MIKLKSTVINPGVKEKLEVWTIALDVSISEESNEVHPKPAEGVKFPVI